VNLKLVLMILTLSVCAALEGCATTTSEFLNMVKECVPENVQGSDGQVVFLGPNPYRPGDLFTRAQNTSGEFIYDGQYQYASLVDPTTANQVVYVSQTPVSCALSQDASIKLDAASDGAATLAKAAIPLSAKAKLSAGGGKVSNIKVENLYVDTISFLGPYESSLKSLAAGNPARKGIQDGGYFASTAVLITDGYSVDVTYGPTFDAKVEAHATIPASEKANLNGSLGITAKDQHTLTYTVKGKTPIAIVARPINKSSFRVQSVGGSGSGLVPSATMGIPEQRGW
jgi:hypothetical protein